MRILNLLLLLTLFCPAMFAAAKSEYGAEILEYSSSFDMSSQSDGKLKVKTRVQVNNKNGLEAGCFVLYTDSFRELTAFSGSIESAGKVIRKLKKSDVQTVSTMSGLAEDSYVSIYEPAALYPFVVTYEYTVT